MRTKKIIAMLLALCLILSAVPVSAATMEQSDGEIAAEQQSGAVTAAPGTPAVPEVAEEVTVLWEDESLRGEYEKHFLMSDGSYQAEVYAYPVHELVDGVWVEIESTNQNARGDVTAGRETTNILDNFVWKDHGVQSSTGLRLYIGSRSGYTARTYIQFATMPTIPAGATITAATMKLTMVSGTSLAYNANAYQVTGGEWDPTTIQWTNKPAADVLLEANISNNDRTKYQFSVLTAVRHWYDGDPTGQNENYGIMLRYYDESLTGYYNSVYSGDVVDTNSRPRLTISYNPLGIAVQEGSSRALTAPNTSGTVTWSSDNTGVATVNSAGYVQGIKAGTTRITASVGGAVAMEYTIHVTIADGVYYISDGADLYLGTHGGIAEGTNTVLQTKATSGRSQLNQLWRIDHLMNGTYSIRPLYKLDMGLTSENGTAGAVEITTIGTTNSWSAVPGTNRWTITYNSGGYVFCCAGTSYMTMYRPYTSLGEGVMTAPSSTATSEYTWAFEKVSSIANQVLLMDSATGASVSGETYYINRGEAVSVEELGIVVSFVSGQSLNQSVSWYSLNTSVVSIDSTTGTMMAYLPDSVATIRAKHIHNGVEYSDTFTIVVNKEMIQFMDNLGALYDVAYAYENGDQTKAFETMFNFIRGQRNDYLDDKWIGIAGNWNTAFVNYVMTNYPALYSYFLCEIVGNSGQKIEFMVSDTRSNGSIDVPHLAATLNRLFYTGETYIYGINTFHVIDDEADALSGWAGDCQSLILQFLKAKKAATSAEIEAGSATENIEETFDEVYDAFYPMIGNKPYRFDYADVITDMDSFNLYPLLCNQSITTGEQLEGVLYGYYYGTTGNVAAKRFTTWIGSYTMDTLRYKFFDYCTNRSYLLFQEWPILKGYVVSDIQQEAFSQAFAYYFWLQKEKE